MSRDTELTRLRQAVRDSRLDIAEEYRGLLYELDFRRRFKESVKRHPLGWIGGAAAAGLLATVFGVGRKSSVGSRAASPAASVPALPNKAPLARFGWIAGAVEIGRILYPVLKPVVLPLVMPMIGGLAERLGRSGLAGKERLR